jgi:hypothetical protein
MHNIWLKRQQGKRIIVWTAVKINILLIQCKSRRKKSKRKIALMEHQPDFKYKQNLLNFMNSILNLNMSK